MNKEQIYDERIAPLMTQVIAIAQEAGIAMVASFQIPTEADPDLCCTTVIPDGDKKDHALARAAMRLARGDPPEPGLLAITITGGKP